MVRPLALCETLIYQVVTETQLLSTQTGNYYFKYGREQTRHLEGGAMVGVLSLTPRIYLS